MLVFAACLPCVHYHLARQSVYIVKYILYRLLVDNLFYLGVRLAVHIPLLFDIADYKLTAYY
jgi:hypothetical protein